MKKYLSFLLVLGLFLFVGCSSNTAQSGEKAGDNSQTETKKTVTLKLAHNLNEQHPVHLSLSKFAGLVEEKSKGEIKIQIYPNGQLGSNESEELEQLQAGAIAMTKVSAVALTPYSDGYNVFTLPYVFANEEHYYKSLDSDEAKEFFRSTKDKGFITLTYFSSGARSFYTVDKPILTPDDLKGLKIRVMGFQSQSDMIEALGGTPVGMPYGDVYTSMQSKVIDGAENNELALTESKHGEVAKAFSLDEHTRIPDVLVVSSKVWDSLTPDQQKIFEEAAAEASNYHKSIWGEATKKGIKDAESMGVKFYEVDKAPFRKAVEPVLTSYGEKYPEVKKLLDVFKSLE